MKVILIIIGILFLLRLSDKAFDWREKLEKRIEEFFKDDWRTITTEDRMKRLHNEKEFMKKHPGTKC